MTQHRDWLFVFTDAGKVNWDKPISASTLPVSDTRLVTSIVSRMTGVSVEAMRGPRRMANISKARHVACYVAHKVKGRSLPRVGQYLNRDHTTVLHGVKRITREMQGDHELAALVAAVSIVATGGRVVVESDLELVRAL